MSQFYVKPANPAPYIVGGILAGLGNGAVNYYTQKDKLAADDIRDKRADERMRWMAENNAALEGKKIDSTERVAKDTNQTSRDVATTQADASKANTQATTGATVKAAEIGAAGTRDAATIAGTNQVAALDKAGQIAADAKQKDWDRLFGPALSTGSPAANGSIGVMAGMSSGTGGTVTPSKAQEAYLEKNYGIKPADYEFKTVFNKDGSQSLFAIDKGDPTKVIPIKSPTADAGGLNANTPINIDQRALDALLNGGKSTAPTANRETMYNRQGD